MDTGCLRAVAVVSDAAVNAGEQVSLPDPGFRSSGLCPGAEVLGRQAVLFNF